MSSPGSEKELEQNHPNRWFKPFIGYDNIPYYIDRNQYKAKKIIMKDDEIGDLEVESIWDRDELYALEALEHHAYGGESVLYFDGKDMRIITRNDVRDAEMRDEIRLVNVEAGGKDGSQLPGYQLRLPNGSTFERIYDLKGSSWVNTETEEEFEDFAIPETEYLLSQIEISPSK